MRLPGQYRKDIEEARTLSDQFFKEKQEADANRCSPDLEEELANLQEKIDGQDDSEEMPLDVVDDIRIFTTHSAFTLEKIIFLHGSSCPKDLYDALESGEILKYSRNTDARKIADYYEDTIIPEYEKEYKEFHEMQGYDVNVPAEYDYIKNNGFVEYVDDEAIHFLSAKLGLNGFLIKARICLPYDSENDEKRADFGWFYSPDFGLKILCQISKWAVQGKKSITPKKKKSNSLSKF